MKKLISILLLMASPAVAQVCNQSFTLRTTSCPAGSLDCTLKGAELSHTEGDDNFINVIDLCNAFDVSGTAANVAGTLTITGTLNLNAGTVDAITEIDASLKSGSDTTLITGTATSGQCAQFDANGDIIGAGAACGTGGSAITTGTAFPGSPSEGDLFIVIDDSAAGACDSAAGAASTMCIYDGASWEPFFAAGYNDYDYGDIAVSGGVMSIEAGAVDSSAIAANTITEADVEGGGSLGAGEDGYVWAWNNTSGAMEFVSNAAGAETDPTLTDDTAVTIGDGLGNDIVLTFDASPSDATITYDSDATTPHLYFSVPIVVAPSATPNATFTDSDTTDEDVSTKIASNCVNTGTGAEDCELEIRAQRSGTDIDAAGSLLMDFDYDDGVRVRDLVLPANAVFESLAAADDNYEFFLANFPVTILGVGCHCRGTCTGTAQISLEDRAGNAMTHTTPTCSTGTGATTYQDVTAGNTLTAGEGLAFDVDNTPNPETDEYTIAITYAVNTIP